MLQGEVNVLRVSLHPQDVRDKNVVAHWRELICAALAERRPVTKGEWVRRVRRQPRRLARPGWCG